MTIETTPHDRQEFRIEIRQVFKATDFGRVFTFEHRDAERCAQQVEARKWCNSAA